MNISDSRPANNSYWDEEIIIAEIPKDTYSKYIVSQCTKNGKTFINLREWYCTSKDPQFKPAKAGAAIPVRLAEQVAQALTAKL